MRLAITILTLLLLTGCDPAKKILNNKEAFDKVGTEWAKQHPCANDTAWIKLPGKVDSIAYPVLVTDTSSLQDIIDSISIALADKYNTSIDDCNRQVDEAFKIGYKKAEYEYSKKKLPVKQPDTVIRTIVDNRTIDVLKADNNRKSEELNKEKDKSAKRLAQRNWSYVLSGLLFLMLLFMIVVFIKGKK